VVFGLGLEGFARRYNKHRITSVDMYKEHCRPLCTCIIALHFKNRKPPRSGK